MIHIYVIIFPDNDKKHKITRIKKGNSMNRRLLPLVSACIFTSFINGSEKILFPIISLLPTLPLAISTIKTSMPYSEKIKNLVDRNPLSVIKLLSQHYHVSRKKVAEQFGVKSAAVAKKKY